MVSIRIKQNESAGLGGFGYNYVTLVVGDRAKYSPAHLNQVPSSFKALKSAANNNHLWLCPHWWPFHCPFRYPPLCNEPPSSPQ